MANQNKEMPRKSAPKNGAKTRTAGGAGNGKSVSKTNTQPKKQSGKKAFNYFYYCCLYDGFCRNNYNSFACSALGAYLVENNLHSIVGCNNCSWH